jgi:hypothetical protein
MNDLLLFPEGEKITNNSIPIRIFKKKNNFMYLPKAYGITMFGAVDYDVTTQKKINPDASFNKTKFIFNQRQIDITNATITGLYNDGCGVLSAGTGAGKTVISIRTGIQLGLRMLVLVPRVDLRTQWINEIVASTENVTVSVLEGADGWEKIPETADIIIATMHCYSLNKWPMEFLETIGTIIIDEVHHFATRQYSQCFMHYCPIYTLALSATSLRIDRLDKIITAYCGKSLYSDSFQHKNNIIVTFIQWSKKLTGTVDDKSYDYGKIHLKLYNGSKKPDHTQMVADVIANPIRNKKIVELAATLARGINVQYNKVIKNSKYRVLVVSSRVSHLKELKSMLAEHDSSISSGLIIGSMKERDAEEAKTKNVLFGNISCVRDGLSIVDLAAMIVCVSVQNLPVEDADGNKSEAWKQLVGRLLRKEHTKPVFVYYISDEYGHFKKHTKSVMEYFAHNPMSKTFIRKIWNESQSFPILSATTNLMPYPSAADTESESESENDCEFS